MCSFPEKGQGTCYKDRFEEASPFIERKKTEESQRGGEEEQENPYFVPLKLGQGEMGGRRREMGEVAFEEYESQGKGGCNSKGGGRDRWGGVFLGGII